MMDTTEDETGEETMLSLLDRLAKVVVAGSATDLQAMLDNDGAALTETPDALMRTLIPFLFTPGSEDSIVDSNTSLQVLVCLVAWKPDLYLKSASRAIKATLRGRLQSPDATFSISTDLLKVLIEQLVSTSDVEVSENAVESVVVACQLSQVSLTKLTLELLHTSLVDTLRDLPTNRVDASTKSVRCLSTVVQLACLGDAATQAAAPCLDMLLQLLQDSADPLLQMSVLDLLERLTTTETPLNAARAVWCLRNASSPLLRLAGSDGNDPDPFMGGASLRTLAAICQGTTAVKELHSEVSSLLNTFPSILKKATFSNADERLILIDATSSFASISETTMDAVLQDRVLRETWLSLSSAQPPLKSAILVSISKSLTRTTTASEQQMGKTLLTALATVNDRSDFTQVVVPLLSTCPVGAYALAEAIILHLPNGPAQRLLPHMVATILGRDPDKDIREARYSVVQAILQSGVKDCLGDDVVKQLQERADNGPHYVKPVRWEVAEQ